MKYYITKAPNGSAMVSTVPPKGKPSMVVDKLPEGDGALMIRENGELYRLPTAKPVPDPIGRLAELIGENGAANAALEDALCDMDAANEERMAAIEDALCEMDMG